MSDAKQASKEAGIYAYSRIAGSVLALLAIALGARLYSKPEFTYISALLLLYESAVALGSLGLADVVFYYIGRSPERAPLIVRQTSFLLLVVAVPVVAVVSVFGLRMDLEMDIARALPWLALTIVIEMPTQPAVNQLLATQRARLASGLYILFAAFRPLAVLAPVGLGISVEWVPIILAMTGVTRFFTHIAIVRGAFPLAPETPRSAWLDKAALRSILLFAFPAGVAVLGGKLNPQIDKYVVEWVRGSEDFLLYAAAAWELPLITLIPYAIGAVMQARYARLYAAGEKSQLRELWLQTVRKTSILVLPLACMMIALGEEAVVVVVGRKYEAAAPLFQIFTLIMLQRVTAYGPMLQSIGETRSLLVTNTLLLLTNIVLSYPFTVMFGFPGAAIATVCANIPPLLFTLWRISLGFECSIGGVMPWRHYLATLALSAIIALGLWFARDVLPGGAGTKLGLGALAYCVVFFVVGRIVGLVSREDADYVRRWLTLDMLRK